MTENFIVHVITSTSGGSRWDEAQSSGRDYRLLLVYLAVQYTRSFFRTKGMPERRVENSHISCRGVVVSWCRGVHLFFFFFRETCFEKFHVRAYHPPPFR